MLAFHFLFRFFKGFLKTFVEFVESCNPIFCAFFNIIEVAFHFRRKLHVNNIIELIFQQTRYNLAQSGRFKLISRFALDIVAVENCGNSRRVSGRSSDTVFFKCLDKRRLVVARGRLSEMLIFRKLGVFQRFAVFDFRQSAALLLFVYCFLI